MGAFGTVDGGEFSVVVEAVLAGWGKHDGNALDCGGIGYGAAYPVNDTVHSEVEFELAAVIGRDGITVSAEARAFGIVCGFRVDEFIQPGDVFGRSDAPDAFR